MPVEKWTGKHFRNLKGVLEYEEIRDLPWHHRYVGARLSSLLLDRHCRNDVC
jgi:hypothetical protein